MNILITGGASGIGEALVTKLASDHRVYTCGRNSAKLAALTKKLPHVKAVACDLARKEGREKLFESLRKDDVNLDVLVNNAGILVDLPLTKRSVGICQELRVNLEAPN